VSHRTRKGLSVSIGDLGPRRALAELVAERDDPELSRYIELYFEETPEVTLDDCRSEDLLGVALSHRDLLDHREPGRPAVRVFNPSYEIDGWTSPCSVVQVVTTDTPFIVDSVTLAIERAGYSMQRVIHPVLFVKRDDNGHLIGLDDGGEAESLVSLEFDRIVDEQALETLRSDVAKTVGQVAAAVAEWPHMVAEAERVAEDLEAGSDAEREGAEFLRWLVADNFIFLGYRRYELLGRTADRTLSLRSVPDSGLGILAAPPGTEPSLVRFADLPPEIGTRATTLDPVHVTKSNSRSVVHRNSRMDYIGVKIIENDRVVGEHRFLGLFTAASYRRPVTEIPILRRIVAETITASKYAPASHNASELLAAIDRYPRDELFLLGPTELLETTSAIVHIGRRREVAVFARQEPFGRYVSCLVLLPRDQLTTTLRHRIEDILIEAFSATDIDYTTQVSESVHARLHYTIVHTRGTPMPDLEVLRAAIAKAAHRWTDELRVALREAFGDAEGSQLHQRYADAFGPAYVDQYSTRAAVSDVTRFETCETDIGVELFRPVGAPGGRLQLKIHRVDAEIRLSDVLPVLQNLGADVLHEQPHVIETTEGRTFYLYDFGLDVETDHRLDMAEIKSRFEDAFLRAWHGEIETDSFNRLVLMGGLSWPEVRVVRAYAAYFRQIGARFSARYVADTLVNNLDITRALIELFTIRFDPELSDADRKEGEQSVLARLDGAVEDVVELDEDRIMRSARNLVLATTRTNYFQRTRSGRPKPYLTLKFDPAVVPDLAPPRPRFETFVFSSRTEGIHLRAGEVARGGLRWSTRLEDYRTEVLGLMSTQLAKNSIIVPTGAKGGFIAKRLQPSADRASAAAEVEACYRLFVSGLLDVTSNRVNGDDVLPDNVVSYDDDGSYLVVAADKGTATFSDVANELAFERGFWLGDAFASGGSAGYDHKAMGITARGAWVSVSRHFRSLGIDVDTDRFTVLGIGDMSGDVFGNGMLLSRRVALLAAFDHRHIMIDPNPDLDASWSERRRLFSLHASTWDDYDRHVLSAGGGIFSRSAKSIAPSPEVRALLQIPSEVETLTPSELIRRLLAMPVDLLWNGGIGTFVKASTESQLDAADKANDGIRIDAPELGCRVVGEGGNLGLTQPARIEFALAGGRVLSDAIDNSAGVATSDIEVNIKILLDSIVASGDLTLKQRNELLASMTDEVAALVLFGNYAQGRAIENAMAEGLQMVEVHERLISELVDRGLLDRSVEPLPDVEALTERQASGVGLTAPELSVLLAHMKNALAGELCGAELGSEAWLDDTLLAYFPAPLAERYRPQILGHRMRPDLAATIVANRVIDRGGLTKVMRLADETGSSWPDVARAHTAAWELFSMSQQWSEIAELDNVVAASVQTEMLLLGRRLVERSTRWLLRKRRHPIDVLAVLGDFGPHIVRAAELIDQERSEAHRASQLASEQRLIDAEVPADLAKACIANDRLVRALDIIETSRLMGCSLGQAASIWFQLEDHLGLDWLHVAISGLPRTERWESLARSALRDELSHTQAELAATVLRQALRSDGDEESVSLKDWLNLNRDGVDRLRELRLAIGAEPSPGMEPVTVILGELRRLVAD